MCKAKFRLPQPHRLRHPKPTMPVPPAVKRPAYGGGKRTGVPPPSYIQNLSLCGADNLSYQEY